MSEEKPVVFECDRCHKASGKPPQVLKLVRSDGTQGIQWWCWSCAFMHAGQEVQDRLTEDVRDSLKDGLMGSDS